MGRKTTVLLAAMFATVMLSACSRDSEPNLLNVKTNTVGPDSFSILPNKPLVLPDKFIDLPTPSKNAKNKADPTPLADAVIALGGNPAGGISDANLVRYTSRFGVEPDIRTKLAREDLNLRRKNGGRVLERVFNVNVYYKAYKAQSLDQYGELNRLRRLGVRTVSAPPRG